MRFRQDNVKGIDEMAKTYKEIYNELIGEKFRAAIISYSPHKGTYEYLGYSHQVEVNALDDIANLIIDDMVFYAFSENEILKLNDDVDLLADLRAAAKLMPILSVCLREKKRNLMVLWDRCY